jgi:peptide/nickel transport system substrate-binding protein
MVWSSPSPYSQVNVIQLYGSKSESNFSYVGNSEIDKLAKVPGTISDQLQAVKAANKAETAALKLYGTTPLDVPPAFVAAKKGLANWGPAGFEQINPLLVGWQK